MKGKNDTSLGMRISEVAEASGVPISTIHYYVKEGLLAPPKKTSRNMTYYDPSTVSEIKLIKELQGKRRLPISAIRLTMNARRDGQKPSHVTEMDGILQTIFCPTDAELQVDSMTEAELAKATAITAADLKALEKIGLVAKTVDDRGNPRSSLDYCVLMIIKTLLEYGFKPADLAIYGEYSRLAMKEADGMHRLFHTFLNREDLPLGDLLEAASELKTCLALREYRRMAGDHGE